MSLAGRHVLVTRPKHQAQVLIRMLQSAGAIASELPLLFIEPPESWEPFDEAFAAANKFDWIVFASLNAVEQTMFRLAERGIALAGMHVAAVGPTTRSALLSFGVETDFQPSDYRGEGLVAEFPGYPALKGVRVLWPRTNIGRTYIADELRKCGAFVEIVHCYRSVPPPDPSKLAQDLTKILKGDPPLDVIALTSSKAAENLALVGRHLDWDFLAGVVLAAIGETTAKACVEAFGRVDLVCRESTIPGLVLSLERFFSG